MRFAFLATRSLRLANTTFSTRVLTRSPFSPVPVCSSKFPTTLSRRNHVSSAGHSSHVDSQQSQLLDPLPISELPPFTRNRLKLEEDGERRGEWRFPQENIRNPESWIALLDQYLPQDLRSSTTTTGQARVSEGTDWEDILALVRNGRKKYHAGVDLFVYMVIQQRRYKAALCLFEGLLGHVNSYIHDSESLDLPSNIVWPAHQNLDRMSSQYGISSQYSTWEPQANQKMQTVEDYLQRHYDSSMDLTFQHQKDETTAFIWQILGDLIIDAADLPQDQSSEVLGLVHKVLAQVHNAGLVPSAVYQFVPVSGSITVQRPPIIHLVSSRILTTMSDAVWRSHQYEAIAEAASSGISFEDIGKDPPGGRFRLKVRQLGPEIWLEFVLWCCVEGGFIRSARHIIRALHSKTANPWFAVDWTTGDDIAPGSSAIDWDRVKSRTGGTIGRIEGYSMDRPFVEVPPRTISSEVVLAVIEGLINSAEVGTDKGLFYPAVCKMILDVLEFLEPHSLASDYFDYLTVRLYQTSALGTRPEPRSLLLWLDTISHARELETTIESAPVTPSFRYDLVLAHSELQAGIMHQSLDAFIQAGYCQSSLTLFGRIQESVDNSKLQAIQSFLGMSSKASDLSPTPSSGAMTDWVQSHGQLPQFKLAAFLNMITDSGLHGLGRWLLHSDDVDGPLIPASSYALSCMTTAVIQYAVKADDPGLAGEALKSRLSTLSTASLEPSVTLLRIYINACITSLDFKGARHLLTRLQNAVAGGFGLSNVATLGATIIRLEKDYVHSEDPEKQQMLDDADALMTDILAGRYDETRDTFTSQVKGVFRRQIGYLLRLFENVESGTLVSYRQSFGHRFPDSNLPDLKPSLFNIVLQALVDVRGSRYGGQKLWTMFCRDPPFDSNGTNDNLPDDIVAEDDDGHDHESFAVDMSLLKTMLDNADTDLNLPSGAYEGEAKVEHRAKVEDEAISFRPFASFTDPTQPLQSLNPEGSSSAAAEPEATSFKPFASLTDTVQPLQPPASETSRLSAPEPNAISYIPFAPFTDLVQPIPPPNSEESPSPTSELNAVSDMSIAPSTDLAQPVQPLESEDNSVFVPEPEAISTMPFARFTDLVSPAQPLDSNDRPSAASEHDTVSDMSVAPSTALIRPIQPPESEDNSSLVSEPVVMSSETVASFTDPIESIQAFDLEDSPPSVPEPNATSTEPIAPSTDPIYSIQAFDLEDNPPSLLEPESISHIPIEPFTDFIQPVQSQDLEDDQSSVPEPKPWLLARPSLDGISPLVCPTINTLRIIVRAAIKEKTDPGLALLSPRARKRRLETPRQVLQWAREYFDAFGVSNLALEENIRDSPVAQEDFKTGTDPRITVREWRPIETEMQFRKGKVFSSAPGVQRTAIGPILPDELTLWPFNQFKK